MGKLTLQPGDVITYAGEDNGGLLMFVDPETKQQRGWTFKPTFAHLDGREREEPEMIVVGTDIPLAECQDLVESGRCVLVADERAPTPSPLAKKAGAPQTGRIITQADGEKGAAPPIETEKPAPEGGS